MPEHLLNIKEVAYKIGDSFLRFRKEQIDAVKQEISDVEEKDPNRVEVKLDAKGRQTHVYTESEKYAKRKIPAARQYDYNLAEKIQDFLYYNDFYILSAIIIAALLLIILRS